MTTTPAVDTTSGAVGPPPPFDPELAVALETVGAGVPRFTPEILPALRQNLSRTLSDDDVRRGGAFEIEERVAGEAGVPLLICRPTGADGPVPCVYWIHGGGMIVGDNRVGLSEALDWAQEFGMAVVSVEYRLAPEHPHPAPVEDCWTGLVWTAGNAAALGVDPDRIVVAGGSAGGGLATGLTLLSRDRGGPVPAALMALYPMLDDRNDTPSSHQMAGLGIWDRASNQTGWSALLGDACGGPDVSPYAAPARATDLSGLPPTFIDVGSAETFRDEAVAFAARLWQAGGRAELHVWPGAFHGFDGFAPQAAVSRDAKAARVRWLRRQLACGK
jgi:acetyl esterase/lipase